jgi:hypothetical protein
MRATPEQTYLAERLQSARGLGWPVDTGAKPPAATSFWQAIRDVPRRLLTICLRFAR